jgi:hypothetical protein
MGEELWVLLSYFVAKKDAQVSIYNVSWERNYGFCCHIDEECAKELAGEHHMLYSPG